MSTTLHIKLKQKSGSQVELRCYTDNPNKYNKRDLDLSDIETLIQQAETDYYTLLPEDFAKTGKQLYQWLDGPDRFFETAIENCLPADEIALAVMNFYV